MNNEALSFGTMLRQWRRHRSLSQLRLAADADISQRHLSFIESSRSSPSRNMVMHLADQLSVPLRERNTLLVAAGFAPSYQERNRDDPELAAARRAVTSLLEKHEPYPALAVDRHWTLVEANRSVAALLDGVDASLLREPLNVLRISLHPQGVAPRIVNFRQWREHVLFRLDMQIDNSADTGLIALRKELQDYPVPAGAAAHRSADSVEAAPIAVPLRIRTRAGVLSFISTTMIFGTALDITLSELAVEFFFPADEQTTTILQSLPGR